MKRLLFALPIALLVAVFQGCPPTGDIGAPCRLVRADPDGGTPIPIKEGEIGSGSDVDVISFGAIECENFVCVRHRLTPRTDDNADAFGTCSVSCVADVECTGLAPEADLTQGPFTCRSLILDAETLAAICNGNTPELCEKLGGANSSSYCAQGATPTDAGT